MLDTEKLCDSHCGLMYVYIYIYVSRELLLILLNNKCLLCALHLNDFRFETRQNRVDGSVKEVRLREMSKNKSE